MARLPIILVPDPVLKQRAHEIENITPEIRRQMDDMLDTMYEGPGIGLAANQVNILNRIFVCDVPEGSWSYEGQDRDGVWRIGGASQAGDPDPLYMVNPEIVWESEEKSVYEEGCLSIPQQFADVVRPAEIVVRYVDYNGKQQDLQAAGLLSHCIQHELDHLNGVLFYDYLSSIKRNMMLRKVKKMKRDTNIL